MVGPIESWVSKERGGETEDGERWLERKIIRSLASGKMERKLKQLVLPLESKWTQIKQGSNHI